MKLPIIGQTVYIDKKGEAGRGHARVLDTSADSLYFDEPMVIGTSETLKLEERAVVQVSYRVSDGSMCYFDAQVLGLERLDQLFCIRLKKPLPKEVTRIQRRAFVRVEMPIEVSFMCLRGQGSPKLVTGRGMTRDISGGGLSFYPEQGSNFEVNDLLTLKFVLPEEGMQVSQPLSAKGTVIRMATAEELAHEQDEKKKHRAFVSLQFTDITEVTQQKIVQFVFKMQLKVRVR